MKLKNLFRFCLLILSVVLLLGTFVSCGTQPSSEQTETEETKDAEKESETLSDVPETPEVVEPYVVSTASLGVTGDILIHETVYKSVFRGDGVYDFTENYSFVKPYFEKYDYMVANLEVTLGGEKPSVGQYPSAYPLFNCPDSIVDALKGAGVDMLLTANNHSYDTRTAGLVRTVQVVREKGLDYLGTRDNTEESLYRVQDINGIKVGMACFTYSTVSSSGIKALNGITMDRDAFPLVSSFDYNNLEGFYQEVQKALDEMAQKGAEATVFYVHWGNEYQYVPNSYQKNIAEKLCEMGVDVIVGGHPHVIQPFETVTAENGNETLCIYSTGNAISNQRQEIMDSDNFSGHTEDGMIFGVTFEKWNDGRVCISQVNIEPLWVNREYRGTRWVFHIVPLDLSVEDWTVYQLTDRTLAKAKKSYNRTLALVGEGLNAAREKLGLDPLVTSIE